MTDDDNETPALAHQCRYIVEAGDRFHSWRACACGSIDLKSITLRRHPFVELVRADQARVAGMFMDRFRP